MKNRQSLLFYMIVTFLTIFIGKANAQNFFEPGLEMPAGYEYGVTSKTITTNGDFSQRGGTINSTAGLAGNQNPATVTGTNYAVIGFWSQARRIANDTYENPNTYNIFSLLKGTKQSGWGWSTSLLNDFPGDPEHNVAPTEYYFYSNGNAFNGKEYVIWGQELTGLITGRIYTFSAYINNGIEPPANAPHDPIVSLRMGGNPGLPNGSVVGGPRAITEAESASNKPIGGWIRIAYTFKATGTTAVVKITSAAYGVNGDDFQMTQAMVTPIQPKLTITATSPCAGGTIAFTATKPAYTGYGTYNYQWTGPNGFSSTEQNPVINNATVANAGEYTCTITDEVGQSATKKLSVVVNTVTAGTITPATQGIPNMTIPTPLTLSGYTAGSTIQWQSSTDNDNFTNIAGATSSQYVFPSALSSTQSPSYYRAVVTSPAGCTSISSSAQIVIGNPIIPVTVNKYATPVENPLDPQNPNAWDVTLKITTGAVTVPVDVVMVIDQSSSMGGANIARLRSAIKSGQEFVRKMLPKGTATEGVRIALVSYDHEPHQLSGFTADTALLCQKIRALTPVWGTHTQGGLKMARNIMATSTAIYKHIILMSDGLATEQYPIKNVTTADFVGKTGNNDDPIDLVIQGAIASPENYVSNDTSTPLINPQLPSNSSKVGRRNLLESKYDYSNLSGRVTFDGVAGALVYEPKFGTPYYYYFPCNAAINEAQFAKNSGYTIHTIGYDLGDFPLANRSLMLTATSPQHFFTATPQNLAGAFNNIAQNINVGVQQGTAVDFVAPGFIVQNVTQSGDVTHLFNVSHGTLYYDINTKKLTWNTGSILSSSEATITYRIYADLDQIQAGNYQINPNGVGPDLGGFDTNIEATLTYTNSSGTPNQHLTFPRPTVKVGYGVIKRHYVLVNKDGQPISADGTVVASLSDAYVLQPQDFFLPTGGDHVAPKWIKLDKTTEALQYHSVTPSNTIITTADGKRYSFVVVTNSTPNPGPIGISWKQPVGNAYFAYRILNYWMGGTTGHPNEWDVTSNWTGDHVPLTGEDVEFATTENFGTPAADNLHVPTTNPKIIGNLINNSDKDLVIPPGSQLTINGKVTDNNTGAGTIVVQSSPDKPTGTLLFANPSQNQSVAATVEFYNKGYDCADCGMYRRSWQYFGIPVRCVNPFPFNDVAGEETIHQWMEPFNGNKWQPAELPMKMFKGYEITNSSNTVPSGVYKMKGNLFVGNATVALTRTADVNYSGANLVGNSYTAAIDIKNALTFPAGVQQTVYLFNTGTRDQWRKLDGSTVSGYQGGQYLAVPQNMAGQSNFPDRIPSMHAFLLRMESGTTANLGIKYDKLVPNTTVNNGNGTQIAWRSNGNGDAHLPFLVMDVLGNESADRLWIFSQADMSFGFDNGWDGRKLKESGISQLYAVDPMGDDKFQVAAVPFLNGLLIGFDAEKEGRYDLEFALSDDYAEGAVFIHDLHSDVKQRIVNGGSYSFNAKRGDTGARFRLSYEEGADNELAQVQVGTAANKIVITNNTSHDHLASVYATDGKLLQRINVPAGSEMKTNPMISGAYVVSLQSPTTNGSAKKVVIN